MLPYKDLPPEVKKVFDEWDYELHYPLIEAYLKTKTYQKREQLRKEAEANDREK